MALALFEMGTGPFEMGTGLFEIGTGLFEMGTGLFEKSPVPISQKLPAARFEK